MKLRYLSPFLAFYVCSIFLYSCKEDNNDVSIVPDDEFAATDASFANYDTWTVVAELDKASSPEGLAHTDKPRTIWINDPSADRSENNQYPQGTIIVKKIEGGTVYAMAKRGGSFNPEHQGWEWFTLQLDGKIKSKPALSSCNSCHALAVNLDYVFSKP